MAPENETLKKVVAQIKELQTQKDSLFLIVYTEQSPEAAAEAIGLTKEQGYNLYSRLKRKYNIKKHITITN